MTVDTWWTVALVRRAVWRFWCDRSSWLVLSVSSSHHVRNGRPGTCSRLLAGRRPHRLLRRPRNRSQHWSEWPPLCWQLVNIHAHPYVSCSNVFSIVFTTQLSFLPVRWSGFLLCAVAMLLVIFPMFSFPKKLPPRHKKRKKKKIGSLCDVSSDDEVMKEKSSSKDKNVSSSMDFGKDIKGEKWIISAFPFHFWRGCKYPT